MRFSGLVLVVVLSVSAVLFAQRSGGFSSGGSHSSSSGGSSSSASSHISSSSGTISRTSSPSNLPSSKLPSSKENAAPEKKGFFSSLRHPFKKTTPVQNVRYKPTRPCFKEPCAVCPSGGSRSNACRVVSGACRSGQTWNGFGCAAQSWSNNCTALANELAAERRQHDPSSALYQLLRNQYEQCERRFGSYAFTDAFLFDTP